MDREAWLARLQHDRAIAVIRAPNIEMGIQMAQAVVAGGFRLIEITWTSDRPATLLDHLRTHLPSTCLVGAGTVITQTDMQAAIAAGAQFCFSPHTDLALMRLCLSQAIPVVPGALTPTEIVSAWQLGASSVKVFPCQAVGGPHYIRHLRGPLPHIALVPTGGITVEQGADYLRMGATAVGMSSSLFLPSLLVAQDWQGLTQRSQTFLASLDAPPC